MKKYITLAALLAAGTACANAAELISSFSSFTGEGQTDSQGLLTVLSASEDGITYVDGVACFDGANVMYIADADAPGQAFGGTVCSEGLTVTMTLSGVAVTSSTINAVVTAHTTGASNWGIGLTSGGKKLQGTWGSGVYGNGVQTQTDVDLTGSFVLTLVCAANGTYAYVDGELVYHNTSLFSSSSSHGFKQLNIGAMSSGSDGAKMNLHSLYVHKGAMTSSEVASFVASIPEPSAFGMLAGLGALALVAARRRRK